MNAIINIIGAILLSLAIVTVSIGYVLNYINHYMYEHMDDCNITKVKQ